MAWSVFTVIVAASWWDPPYPGEQALHHSLTLIAIVALVWLQRRGLLPTSSLVLALLFLTLHTIAARWMYSYVPYDDWLQRIAGVRLADLFGWERNHFDRLVHLAYGVYLAPVLFTYFTAQRGWRVGWAALAAVDAVISTGALYEVLEWGIAITAAPAYAEAYNGQQGDIFDPHKDMAIAALGAIIAVAVVLLARRLRQRRGSEGEQSAQTVVHLGGQGRRDSAMAVTES
jgi:putative membrane protein